jgi:hypothetical protein
MKPKEKAKELVSAFSPQCAGLLQTAMNISLSKLCAIKCVNEIIQVTHSDKRANSPFDKEWWIKVKTEIEKL